jgi:hypothetical protein
VRKERILLKNSVDIALMGRGVRNVFTLEEDLTCGGLFKPSDHFKCGGLAASGRSQHGEELTTTYSEVGFMDGDKRSVLLANIYELYNGIPDVHPTSFSNGGKANTGGVNGAALLMGSPYFFWSSLERQIASVASQRLFRHKFVVCQQQQTALKSPNLNY